MTPPVHHDRLDADLARRWIQDFIGDFERHEEALSDLDRRSGDGDFGLNMRSALNRVHRTLERSDTPAVADVFTVASGAFLQTGGTSGPLLGMWFRDMAAAADTTMVGIDQLASGVTVGTATVQRLGNASTGHKTMVDAMVPAAEALTRLVDANVTLSEALQRAAAAARIGAESTRHLYARRGRATYVGDLAAGVTDPGAALIALFFESAPFDDLATPPKTAGQLS